MAQEVMLYSWGETLGDGLVKLPAIAAARRAFPEAKLTWMAAQGSVYAGALNPLAAPLLDEIVTHAPSGGLRPLDALSPRPFAGRRFDVVIDTQLLFLPSVTAMRAARGLFISAMGGFALSARRPAPGAWPGGLADQLAALVGLAAGRPAALEPIVIREPRLLAAAACLLPDGPTYVGLAPGAGVRDKAWPLDNYLALARGLAARGLTPVFLVGPQEEEWLPRIRAEAPGALVPEWDRTDPYPDVKGPLLAAALAGRLAAAVANDSGVGHALAAGGAPLVSLQLSARKAIKFRPAARRLELVVAEAFGPDMAAVPLDVVEARLAALMEAS